MELDVKMGVCQSGNAYPIMKRHSGFFVLFDKLDFFRTGFD